MAAAISVIDVLFPGERQRSQQFRRSLSKLESATPFAGTSLRAAISFDAVVTRDHRMASTLPESSLEDGTEITDHLILSPRELTLLAIVSDHPLDPEVLARLPEPEVGADGFPIEEKPARSQVAAGFLEALWRDGVRLKVVTKFKTYENMVIYDMSWHEAIDVGEALEATIQLREIRTTVLATVNVERLAPSSADLAAGKVERGRRSTKPQSVIGSINDAKARAGTAIKNLLTGNF